MVYTGINQDISNLYSTTAYGQKSDTVKQLQQALINAGYSISAGATGYYGDQTQAALDQWKKTLTTPSSTIPKSGMTEINNNGSPAINHDAGTISALGAGATTSATNTISDLQKRLDEIANQKPSEEIASTKKSIIDLITKRETVKANQTSAEDLRKQAITQAYSEMGVTPEQVQKIGGLIGEVTEYNKQLADLEIKKQNALDKVQTAGVSTDFYNGEQNQISKTYNSEISAKAAQAGIKVQELQMIQGAYTDAKATAAQIVELKTYDQQQEVADIEWSLDTYKDLYSLMDKEEQSQWDKQYTLAKDALDTAKTTLTNRSKYVVDPETADAFKGIDWTTLTDEEFNNTLSSYTSSQAYLNKLAKIAAAGREPSTGSSTTGLSSSDDSKFWSQVNVSINELEQGKNWGEVWNRLKAQFPNVSNSVIDNALGGGMKNESYFEGPTGKTVTKQTPWGWAKPNAYEEFKGKGGNTTVTDQKQMIWSWLATDGANLSDEQKKQEIMKAGFNPQDFNLY